MLNVVIQTCTLPALLASTFATIVFLLFYRRSSSKLMAGVKFFVMSFIFYEVPFAFLAWFVINNLAECTRYRVKMENP